MTTAAAKLYPCVHCKNDYPAESFSPDIRNAQRNYLKSWCKACSNKASKRSRFKKRQVEQRLKAEQVRASQHPISKPYVYENFTAIDTGDIGVMVRINNPTLPDEMLAERFPPSEVNALIDWLARSNESKLPKERQRIVRERE